MQNGLIIDTVLPCYPVQGAWRTGCRADRATADGLAVPDLQDIKYGQSIFFFELISLQRFDSVQRMLSKIQDYLVIQQRQIMVYHSPTHCGFDIKPSFAYILIL